MDQPHMGERTRDGNWLEPGTDHSMRPVHWALLAACLALFAALRLRWIGHLLVWDEAMTLCTVRAFKAGAHDAFADWFWRHPPIHSLLLLLLAPFRAGFAERAETLSVFIAAINQLLLFALNRRLFGTTVALWSAFFLAILPGAVLFDVWIKADHLVATFGLLAIWFLLSRRSLPAGTCLGVALLCKETAVFYALAVGLLWLCGACGRRTRRDFLALTIVPALTCGWWYLIVLPLVSALGPDARAITWAAYWQSLLHGLTSEHLRFAVGTETGFQHRWFFYGARLLGQLGWLGLAFAIGGLALIVRSLPRKRGIGVREWFARLDARLLWPVLLLVPSLCLLSMLRSKVPWVVISLFVAWATLAAIAMGAVWDLAAEWSGSWTRWRKTGPALVSVCVVVLALVFSVRRDYESALRATSEDQWRGASYSREAAVAMNELCRDGERALLTSFHYWKGVPPGHPCPVFAYYFVRNVEVLIRPHTRSFADLAQDVREYRLDWALLSPEPGPAEYEVFGGFEKQLKLTPRPLPQARLYQTMPAFRTE